MSTSAKFPAIQWTANQGALTGQLLEKLQKKENFVILFGKKDAKENTSSDRKITVYERIAQEIWPDDFKIHSKTLGKRVKGKAEDLVTTYKEKAARLRVTGGRVGALEDAAASQDHQYLDYYIPEDGPHHDTPAAAVNLWQQLNKEFPYFSELHKFLSTRPNVVPPIITTGIGPQGRRIVHNQLNESTPASQVFDNSQIDPSLLGLAATPPRPSLTHGDPDETPCHLISTNSRISSLETPKLKAPKPSTFGRDLTNAMAKARQNVQHVPKKRSLEDVIIESSRENIAITRERAAAQAEHCRQNLLVVQKKLIMDLFTAGLKTLDEARAELAALDNPSPDASTSRRSPPRTPHTRRTFHSSSPILPDSPTRWSIENSQALLPEDSAEI